MYDSFISQVSFSILCFSLTHAATTAEKEGVRYPEWLMALPSLSAARPLGPVMGPSSVHLKPAVSLPEFKTMHQTVNYSRQGAGRSRIEMLQRQFEHAGLRDSPLSRRKRTQAIEGSPGDDEDGSPKPKPSGFRSRSSGQREDPSELAPDSPVQQLSPMRRRTLQASHAHVHAHTHAASEEAAGANASAGGVPGAVAGGADAVGAAARAGVSGVSGHVGVAGHVSVAAPSGFAAASGVAAGSGFAAASGVAAGSGFAAGSGVAGATGPAGVAIAAAAGGAHAAAGGAHAAAGGAHGAVGGAGTSSEVPSPTQAAPPPIVQASFGSVINLLELRVAEAHSSRAGAADGMVPLHEVLEAGSRAAAEACLLALRQIAAVQSPSLAPLLLRIADTLEPCLLAADHHDNRGRAMTHEQVAKLVLEPMIADERERVAEAEAARSRALAAAEAAHAQVRAMQEKLDEQAQKLRGFDGKYTALQMEAANTRREVAELQAENEEMASMASGDQDAKVITLTDEVERLRGDGATLRQREKDLKILLESCMEESGRDAVEARALADGVKADLHAANLRVQDLEKQVKKLRTAVLISSATGASPLDALKRGNAGDADAPAATSATLASPAIDEAG